MCLPIQPNPKKWVQIDDVVRASGMKCRRKKHTHQNTIVCAPWRPVETTKCECFELELHQNPQSTHKNKLNITCLKQYWLEYHANWLSTWIRSNNGIKILMEVLLSCKLGDTHKRAWPAHKKTFENHWQSAVYLIQALHAQSMRVLLHVGDLIGSRPLGCIGSDRAREKRQCKEKNGK